jgi:cell division inhibitor SepF
MMMMSIVSKLKNWVTGEQFEDEDELMEDEQLYTQATGTHGGGSHHVQHLAGEANQSSSSQRNLKVLNHPNNASFSQVVVIEPSKFEEALEIVHHLKGRKAVILNLHLLDTTQSQRVVDFLAGATHAIEGHQQRIGDGVFIFTPNVAISAERPASAQQAEGLTLSNAYWN